MRHSAAAIAALLLVSCSSQQKSGNEAAANESGGTERGGTAATMPSLQPGQWETTVEMIRMSVPNMPQGLTPPRSPPTVVSHCLTPEQAAQPNANFLTGSGDSGGCTYENFSMRNGRLQGTLQCNTGDATMRATLDGSFTPTSYDLTMQAQSTASGVTMDMETRTTARRTGDCPG